MEILFYFIINSFQEKVKKTYYQLIYPWYESGRICEGVCVRGYMRDVVRINECAKGSCAG